MPEVPDRAEELRVLQNKRDATRYQILVQLAERQPAVSQLEIAETLGITSQAVSQYFQDLVDQGYVRKLGRGRYEITNEGVDWVLAQTDALQEYTQYVSDEVIEQTDVETAIATEPITAGQEVSLSMEAGVLYASPDGSGSATATALTDAESGQDIGLTDFEGLLEYDLGRVTIVVVPPITEGGSASVAPNPVAALVDEHDMLAVGGTEALALAKTADCEPDIRFGTAEAVQEAAVKGLDVVLLVGPAELSSHVDRLREYDIAHEVVEEVETG